MAVMRRLLEKPAGSLQAAACARSLFESVSGQVKPDHGFFG